MSPKQKHAIEAKRRMEAAVRALDEATREWVEACEVADLEQFARDVRALQEQD